MNRIYLYTAILTLIVGCKQPQQREYQNIIGFTQGTSYKIIYHDQSNRDFSGEVNLLLEKIDSSMSLYRNSSIINRFNESSTGIMVDSLFAHVAELSIRYSHETDGAFDFTVGPLVKAWGFHAKRGEMPDSLQLVEMIKHTGAGMVIINGLQLSKVLPDVQIDVNAIAQGYTVDVIAQLFDKKGIADYLVEVGGEVRTKGKSPRGDKWLVGIDRPDDHALSGENLQVIVALSGMSLVTSGNYRRFFVKDGVKYSHTINPKSGYPVNHTLLSATVIDSTAARADALATAFMVMGLELTKEWLEKNSGVEAYLIYSGTDGEYNVWMSKGMEKYIKKK